MPGCRWNSMHSLASCYRRVPASIEFSATRLSWDSGLQIARAHRYILHPTFSLERDCSTPELRLSQKVIWTTIWRCAREHIATYCSQTAKRFSTRARSFLALRLKQKSGLRFGDGSQAHQYILLLKTAKGFRCSAQSMCSRIIA